MNERVDFNICTVEELNKATSREILKSPRPTKFLHLFNPVLKEPDHELAKAQSITLHSMDIAAKLTRITNPSIDIEMIATVLPEDEAAVPSYFTRLEDLKMTSLDVFDFAKKRRLPIMNEILSRGRDAALKNGDAENTYLIFTNVDIALTAHFYDYCYWLTRLDYDFMIINRRGIRGSFNGIEDLAAIQSNYGVRHPGMDCFIIRADLMKHLKPVQSVVGMSSVERSFYYNMIAYTKKAVHIKNAHATFHLGVDSPWMSRDYRDYQQFNKNEAVNLVKRIEQADPVVKQRLEHFVRITGRLNQFPPGVLQITDQEKTAFKVDKTVSSRIARQRLPYRMEATFSLRQDDLIE